MRESDRVWPQVKSLQRYMVINMSNVLISLQQQIINNNVFTILGQPFVPKIREHGSTNTCQSSQF